LISKLSTFNFKSDSKSRWFQRGPHPPSPEKGYGGTSKGFCPPAKRDRDAYLKYVEGGNPRRTQLIEKITIYVWKLGRVWMLM
jgi:hypothetical protein